MYEDRDLDRYFTGGVVGIKKDKEVIPIYFQGVHGSDGRMVYHEYDPKTQQWGSKTKTMEITTDLIESWIVKPVRGYTQHKYGCIIGTLLGTRDTKKVLYHRNFKVSSESSLWINAFNYVDSVQVHNAEIAYLLFNRKLWSFEETVENLRNFKCSSGAWTPSLALKVVEGWSVPLLYEANRDKVAGYLHNDKLVISKSRDYLKESLESTTGGIEIEWRD
jgi:hypothetical protein